MFTGIKTKIKRIKIKISPNKQKKVPNYCYKNVRISRQIRWFVDYKMVRVRTNLKELKKTKKLLYFTISFSKTSPSQTSYEPLNSIFFVYIFHLKT